MKTILPFAFFIITLSVLEGVPDPGEAAKVKADPEYLTQTAAVHLTARSNGGKSRWEPWKTDYGSYDRTDVSSYQLVCSLLSTYPGPQRVRMQAFRISRNLASGTLDVKLIQDCNVTYGTNVTVTVSATLQAVNTDVNYAALGERQQGGDKFLGWSWRALDGRNRTIAVASSQPCYDKNALAQPVNAPGTP